LAAIPTDSFSEGDTITYPDNTADSSTNYYYQVHGIDGDNNTASTSNETGVFRFQLVPGS